MAKLRRILGVAATTVALVTGTVLVATPTSAADPTSVTIASTPTDGETRDLNGINVRRTSNDLILYNKAGTTTGTNQYGTEVAVVDGKVTDVQYGVGDMAIPAGGYVLSGHGTSNTWLRYTAHTVVGDTVTLNGGDTPPPPPPPPPPPDEDADASSVTANGQTLALKGTNVYRSTNTLVRYTPAHGTSTGTNQWGTEATVVDGKVTALVSGVGNASIPANGYVLSGHGTSSTWLKTNAKVGTAVTLNGGTTQPPPPTGATEKLPDIVLRTINTSQMTIEYGPAWDDATKEVKKLKLPTTTSNIGVGALEINSKRTSSTSTDWVGKQVIYMSDGTKKSVPTPGPLFNYGSDGHNHFHVLDLNDMSIFNANGQKLRTGVKRGFCFEDNTGYRDWPSTGTNGAKATPTYTPTSVPPACGAGDRTRTDVTYGLSVGWGDTYPVTLPDQYIDITGLSNGRYRVQVNADWDNWFKELDETNNVSWVDIQLKGDAFEVIATGGGF